MSRCSPLPSRDLARTLLAARSRSCHAHRLVCPNALLCILAGGIAAALPATATADGDNPAAEKVQFDAADGYHLFGEYYAAAGTGNEAPIVILLHMYRSDRSAFKPLIGPLHDAGFAVLAFDFRGHGESATPESEKRVRDRDPRLFEEMYDDVRGAYDFLALQPGVDRSRFAIVGASVGCSIALRYAVQDRSVDAIVCLTPGTDYLGLDSRQDLQKVVGRKILLTATADERAACDALQRLADGVTVQIQTAGTAPAPSSGDTQLTADTQDAVAGQRAHGTQMFGRVPEIEDRIVKFLLEGVGPAASEKCFGTINSNIYHKAGSAWFQEISPSNLRYYSSPKEAESRGLRESKTRGPRPESERDRPRRRP